MIRPIMTKKFFLRQPSEPATADDLAIALDLIDTLEDGDKPRQLFVADGNWISPCWMR